MRLLCFVTTLLLFGGGAFSSGCKQTNVPATPARALVSGAANHPDGFLTTGARTAAIPVTATPKIAGHTTEDLTEYAQDGASFVFVETAVEPGTQPFAITAGGAPGRETLFTAPAAPVAPPAWAVSSANTALASLHGASVDFSPAAFASGAFNTLPPSAATTVAAVPEPGVMTAVSVMSGMTGFALLRPRWRRRRP